MLTLWRRLRYWLNREARERDLQDELQFHLEMTQRELEASGVDAPTAAASARRAVGNVPLMHNQVRDVWVWPWLQDASQDLRYALRALRRHPGFTAVAVVALALGIGANTAVFTVVDALWLRPPPFEHADRLYWIYDINDDLGLDLDDAVGPSPGNFVDWRAQSRSFDYLVAWRNWWFSVAGPAGGRVTAEQVRGVHVSPAFFDMLGVQAKVGRTFRPDEEVPGRDRVVVLTHGYWQRRFGGDADVIGTSVLIDGASFSVIGVLPPSFYFLWSDSAIFMPMTVDSAFRDARTTHSVVVLARLADGVTEGEAQREMDYIALNLARVHPDTNASWGTALRPVFPLNETMRPALLVLLGAVGCVLLIACLNVATLLSARAAVRQREVAVRVAVGASRGRVIRQLLTESGVLAALGAAGGVAVALVGLRGLVTVVPPVQITRALTLSIDARALGVTAVVAGLTAIVFGLAPALQASRHPWLQIGPRSSWRVAVGRVLLPVQVAMSVVLLAGAALMIRSLWNLQQVDPGFRADGLVTLQLWLPEERYPEAADISGFLTNLLQRLGDHPEVTAVGLTNTRPFLGWDIGVSVDVPGYVPRSNEVPTLSARIISPDTFAALGTRLIRGRVLEARDGWEQAGAVLVNEAMVRRFWPEDDPVGLPIAARFLASAPAAPWWPYEATHAYTVVGVVEDVKERRLGEDVAPMVYFSYRQTPTRYTHLLLRTTAPTVGIASALERELHAIDPALGVYDVRSMDSVLGEAVAEPRLNASLFAAFAAVALWLSAVGVYGVTAYAAQQRTHELAVRAALGATGSTLFGLVTREALIVAILGVVMGLVGAWTLGGVLTTLIYGIEPTNVWVLAIGSGMVLVLALAASCRPAWRASRVDPVRVLRAE